MPVSGGLSLDQWVGDMVSMGWGSVELGGMSGGLNVATRPKMRL